MLNDVTLTGLWKPGSSAADDKLQHNLCRVTLVNDIAFQGFQTQVRTGRKTTAMGNAHRDRLQPIEGDLLQRMLRTVWVEGNASTSVGKVRRHHIIMRCNRMVCNVHDFVIDIRGE